MLEEYEWTNFWWEHANDATKRRILLIGDSITRAYLPYVNSFFNGEVYVDALTSSRSLDNPDYLFELKYALGHYRGQYDAIHFNNGLHGWHLSLCEFELHYKEALVLISKEAINSKIILASSTPVYNQPDFKLNSTKNGIIKTRNACITSIAQENNLLVNDLYSQMLDKRELFCHDGIHFSKQGEQLQGELVGKFIKSIIAHI